MKISLLNCEINVSDLNVNTLTSKDFADKNAKKDTPKPRTTDWDNEEDEIDINSKNKKNKNDLRDE
eukprot:CAMPEP_0116944042 /NCGR_PEP_ID=MMETSP0467-20121206/35562_1 /TAXON_ID=283647 /ORGANISM="Mesodinium pulex, Strain SPMC105" /LENGTH=65 /DNA_ID=CAMNT_0004627369 /DNA_START=216 /DNA_END=413 /DNA_ORIENTATION=-